MNPEGTAPGSRLERTRGLLLMIVGILIAVIYAQVLLGHTRGRWVAPLRDDLIFFQYARTLAEGRPYCFHPASPAEGTTAAERTTGATSHLYVFALAGLYAAGCRGDGLIGAAFGLNALLWLASLYLIYRIARVRMPNEAFAAALLMALSGPISFGYFALHDMGLASTLFLLAFYALLQNRGGPAAAALFLFSWARPEGLLIALSLAIAGLCALRRRCEAKPNGADCPATANSHAVAPRVGLWLAAGAAGLIGSLSVGLFNYMLTGEVAFASMKGKGLFENYPFHAVLTEISRTLARLISEVFLGSGESGRACYFPPLIIIPAALGFLPRWRQGSVETWLALSAAAVVLTVSASGFSGLQHDKYLLWVFVLTVLYGVGGLPQIETMVGGRIRWTAIYAIGAAFSLAGTLYFLGDYGRRCAEEAAVVAAVENFRRLSEPPATGDIGVVSGSGIQYYLPDRRIINLNGITHRAFASAWGNPAAQIEILNAQPQWRPAYWLLSESERGELTAAGLMGARQYSTPSFFGADAHVSLWAAQYENLEGVRQPAKPEILDAIRNMTLADQINIGHPDDEAAHRYRRFERLAGVRLGGGIAATTLGGRPIVEAGYAVLGDEEFEIAVIPNKDLIMVARTALRLTAASLLGPRRRERFEVALTPPVRIRLSVNGEPAAGGEALSPVAAEMDERMVRIAAGMIRSPKVRIRISGDHIAFHYWFYQ